MAPTLEQIAKEELEICRSIMAVNGPIKCLPSKNLPEFVERSLLLHRNLIERWDGCVWYGQPHDGTANDDTSYRIQAASELWREHRERDTGARLRVINTVGNSIFATVAGLLSERLLDERNLYHVCSLEGTVAGYRGSIPVRHGQRISSLISRLVKHICHDALKERMHPMPAEYIQAWDRLCKELGERVWTAKSVPTAVALSVRPSHFLSLGNLNEGNSCYKNGSQHDSSKVHLGADVPDSFVVLAYRGRSNIEGMRASLFAPQGRAWGIAVPDKGAVFTNFYKVGKALLEKNVLEACEGGLGVKAPKTFSADTLSVRNHNSAFYTNADVSYYGPNTGGYALSSEVIAYLHEVLEYSSTHGKWTNTGAGPIPLGPAGPEPREILQENPVWRLEVDRQHLFQRDEIRAGLAPHPMFIPADLPRWIVAPNPNYGKLFPFPKLPVPPKLWPYKDFDLILGSQAAQLKLKDAP